ncbi:MAG: glutamine synthetase family protein [Paracoccaceae bacterium]|nr:glutamine synthetase family protein [Paracoccaceae bacterium]
MSYAEQLAAFRAAYQDIETAEVYVTDLNGVARGKLVPAAMLEKLGGGGMKMPTSTLGLDIFGADCEAAGIALDKGDPDGSLIPVGPSLAPLAWAERPTAQIQCMLSAPDGEGVCGYDPRGVLARVAERTASMGFTPVMALELEFYLIDPEKPAPPVNPEAGGRLERAQIYDMGVMRSFEPVIAGITEAARTLGAPAETAICEFGAGQFEMNLTHTADPLAAADHLVALKRAIRGVARAQRMDATFMPKPYGDMSGSGMHIHLSLTDRDGRNIFDGGGTEPNDKVKAAVGGMLRAMPDCMLIFAPHQNSYRRFMPGSYAPVVAAWGLDNRGTALRVPETAGKGARIEHRVAGADTNPYLLAAAVLAAALDGIERGTDPGAPVTGEASGADGAELPLSWVMAEQALSGSRFVADWLGEEFRAVFAAVKRQERATLMARIPDVEYDAYLRTL